MQIHYERYVLVLRLVFFFKQKTAYEVRIGDWSSDVCSSDLAGHAVDHAPALDRRARRELVRPALNILVIVDLQEFARVIDESLGERAIPGPRSEEHTSELQSLMRISYAVFCLKKKKRSMKKKIKQENNMT